MMRQKYWYAAEGSFDVHMYYDRVVHNYGIMSWEAFVVPLCVAVYMLMEIQVMGFFLRTSHRDSIATCGGQIERGDPLQVICQVNGAGPTGWVGVTSVILKHNKGHKDME